MKKLDSDFKDTPACLFDKLGMLKKTVDSLDIYDSQGLLKHIDVLTFLCNNHLAN